MAEQNRIRAAMQRTPIQWKLGVSLSYSSVVNNLQVMDLLSWNQKQVHINIGSIKTIPYIVILYI